MPFPMSEKTKIKPHEHIIFPLDFSSQEEAIEYINLLHDHVGLFKVGLELLSKKAQKYYMLSLKQHIQKYFLI